MKVNSVPQCNGRQSPIQVIYDDQCNLCLGLLNFFQPKIGQLVRVKFIPQHSAIGEQLLADYKAVQEMSGSMVVIKHGQYYTKSDAVIQMAEGFSGGWKALRLLKWIPHWLRDWGYSLIASHRYRIFGRRTACACDREKQ